MSHESEPVWSGGGTLKKIAITGGAALTICRADDPFGLSWDRDQIVFGQLGKELIEAICENEKDFSHRVGK